MTEQAPVIVNDPRRFPFPPALPVVLLLVSWGLGKVLPFPVSWPLWSRYAGLVLFVVPFSLAIWASRTFHRHGTVVNPLGDVTKVVRDGPFRYTRNPMYLTLVLSYAGASLLFHLVWGLVLLPVLVLVLHFGVILREEKYLRAKFGEDYADYQRQVRRWL